jgi:Rod binding domain-containing protein
MDKIASTLPASQPPTASLEILGARARSSKDSAEVDKIAKEFERMALAQMLALMETETDMSDTMFGGGAGERAFKPFLTEEYAKSFSERGGIGIATAVKREILKIQESLQSSGGK